MLSARLTENQPTGTFGPEFFEGRDHRYSVMKQDYKTPVDSGRERRPNRRHYVAGATCAVVLGLVLVSVSSDPARSTEPDLADFAGGDVRALEVPPLMETSAAATSALKKVVRQLDLTVNAGDSLAVLFDRNGVSANDLHEIMQLGGPVRDLRQLRPGDLIKLTVDENGNLLSLATAGDSNQRMEILRAAEGFKLVETELPVQRQVRVASGSITSSLYQAGYEAGLSDALIMSLANIFGWDIDFALDIRKGDQFRVIYEEIYRDGEKVRDGNILAATFINDGRELNAVRFEDEDGDAAYYSPDGKPMRKAFLRAPLNFSYVSSGFNPKRFHPITKRVKAHNGIDYRAPAGTPVYAAGDGRVIRSSYNKYNGNHVFIQHGQKYVTKYLHFSRRAVKVGERVQQGQVIGYVGSTGLSTAAHLHYEFLVNGVHRNPRTVKLPDAEPLPEKYRAQFAAASTPLLRQLDLLEPAGTRVAVAP